MTRPLTMLSAEAPLTSSMITVPWNPLTVTLPLMCATRIWSADLEPIFTAMFFGTRIV